MARNQDKGLYLPLRINLDEWEKSLMGADADLKKAMRQMTSEIKDLKFRYSVEIEGAKASGDYMRAIQLRTAQTNQLLETQTRIVNALSKAYANLDKEKEDPEKVRKWENELNVQRKILYQLQQEQSNIGEGIGAMISDALASASPEFAKFRNIVKSVSGELVAMTGVSKTALTALKGLGGAAILAAGAYQGLKLVTNNLHDMANAAAEAAEPVYQLREEMGSTYEEAERLHTAVKVDGGDARVLVADLNQLFRSMKRGNGDTSMAAKTMKAYGVELADASGHMKSHIEVVRELANGLKRAQAVGQGADFLAGTGLGNNKWMHLLNDLDYYLNKADEVNNATKKEYTELHNLNDMRAAAAESARELAIAKGQLYGGYATENLQKEIDANKALAKYYQDNANNVKEWAKAQGELAATFVDIKNAKDMFASDTVNTFASLLKDAKDFIDYVHDTKIWQAIFPEGDPMDVGGKYVSEAKKMREQEQAEREYMAEIEEMQKNINEKYRKEEQEKITAVRERVEEEKKAAEAYKKFNDAMFNATASDYDKAIKRIQDEKQAFLDARVSEVDAERLYAIQKAQIDQQYYDKRKAEEDAIVKKTQESYQKQIEAAKRAREASISEAEQTLRTNLKLVRHMERVRKQGGDYETEGRQYAERLYLRQNGFRQNDIDLLKQFGVSFVKDIANVRDRLFADFAPNQTVNNTTNNTTVNIDRPVLTDEALVNQLAGKILDKIAPAFKQPDSVNTLA